MDETRQEKIARIKREIAAGTYVTEERLREALRRMLLEIDKAPSDEDWGVIPDWRRGGV